MLGKVTKSKIMEGLRGLIDDYQDEIGQAFLKCNNDLSIAMNIKIAPTETSGANKVTTSISFVESRIKDSIEAIADEEQKNLPGM